MVFPSCRLVCPCLACRRHGSTSEIDDVRPGHCGIKLFDIGLAQVLCAGLIDIALFRDLTGIGARWDGLQQDTSNARRGFGWCRLWSCRPSFTCSITFGWRASSSSGKGSPTRRWHQASFRKPSSVMSASFRPQTTASDKAPPVAATACTRTVPAETHVPLESLNSSAVRPSKARPRSGLSGSTNFTASPSL
jgi:hypothetical protein